MKAEWPAWTLLVQDQKLLLLKKVQEVKMKIGLSYSRCVRDIVDGAVDIEDVLVIISRTNFDPNDDEQWAGIWEGYHNSYGLSNPEWRNYPPEDEGKFRSISIELWESGKLHQPRKFGAHPRRLPYIWLDSILPSQELDKEPGVKAAWEKFLTMARLTGVKLDDNYIQ